MNRRAFLFMIPALVVSADLDGSHRKAKADARCGVIGRILARDGISDRDQRVLDRKQCHLVDGQWRSSRLFTA